MRYSRPHYFLFFKPFNTKSLLTSSRLIIASNLTSTNKSVDLKNYSISTNVNLFSNISKIYSLRSLTLNRHHSMNKLHKSFTKILY